MAQATESAMCAWVKIKLDEGEEECPLHDDRIDDIVKSLIKKRF